MELYIFISEAGRVAEPGGVEVDSERERERRAK